MGCAEIGCRARAPVENGTLGVSETADSAVDVGSAARERKGCRHNTKMAEDKQRAHPNTLRRRPQRPRAGFRSYALSTLVRVSEEANRGWPTGQAVRLRWNRARLDGVCVCRSHRQDSADRARDALGRISARRALNVQVRVLVFHLRLQDESMFPASRIRRTMFSRRRVAGATEVAAVGAIEKHGLASDRNEAKTWK
ncbi:hypothetical protein DFH11DRAFT_1625506 [Phellopilus nigrolimitatus]|nr:hypothetical protein DFH11DRAFT_1625506 [Phellopilus nigrolimitatus]